MRRHLTQILLMVMVWAPPLSAMAQASLKSANFQLDAVNFGSSFTIQSSQIGSSPVITEGPNVTEIEAERATIEWKTDKKSNSTVKYGLTASYDDEVGNVNQVTAHKITLQGLTTETLYHYKVISIDSSGFQAESGDKTFTTTAEGAITSIKISNIGYDKALVSWTTGDFTSSEVQYGTSTSYGSAKSTTSRSFTTEHAVELTELTPGTQYHFRIVATNEKARTDRSNDQTFNTIAQPAFVSITTNPLSPNEMALNWQTNTSTSGIVKYRQVGAPASDEQTAGSAQPLATHSLTLKSLIGSTEYQYSITATDELGTQVESGNRRFTTPVDKEPPVISDLKVAVTRSGDELVMTASWKTNEPTKSQMVYGPKNRLDEINEVPGSSGLNLDHTLVSTGLRPSTPYSLTAFATDPAGNRGKADISFISPKFRKNIFQLIIDTFFNRFGFLTNLLPQ